MTSRAAEGLCVVAPAMGLVQIAIRLVVLRPHLIRVMPVAPASVMLPWRNVWVLRNQRRQ